MIAYHLSYRCDMPEPNHHKRLDKSTPSQPVLASILLLAALLSAGCKQPAPRTAPASATASPAVNNQPAERTPEEIALIDAAIKGDTAAVEAFLDRGVKATN